MGGGTPAVILVFSQDGDPQDRARAEVKMDIRDGDRPVSIGGRAKAEDDQNRPGWVTPG